MFDKYVKEQTQWTDEVVALLLLFLTLVQQVKNDIKSAWDKHTESLKKKYEGMDKSKPEDAELLFAASRAKEGMWPDLCRSFVTLTCHSGV